MCVKRSEPASEEGDKAIGACFQNAFASLLAKTDKAILKTRPNLSCGSRSDSQAGLETGDTADKTVDGTAFDNPLTSR